MKLRRLGSVVVALSLAGWMQMVGASEPKAASNHAAQTKPNFSGDWQLNAKASDDPRTKLREAMQVSRQATDGGRGMGGGMGRGGRGKGRGDMGGAGGAGGMGGASAELSGQLAVAQRLHINHEDPVLLIVDENERPQRLYTDFRGGSVSAGGGLEQRVSVAGWEGGALVVETTMLGRKTVQQYVFDKVNEQLLVTTHAEVSSMPRVSYRLVYDRVKPDPHGQFAAATSAGAERTVSQEETRR